MKNDYIGRLAIIRQRFPSNLAHPKVNLLDCCQQMNDINFSFPYRNSLLRGEMRKNYHLSNLLHPAYLSYGDFLDKKAIHNMCCPSKESRNVIMQEADWMDAI